MSLASFSSMGHYVGGVTPPPPPVVLSSQMSALKTLIQTKSPWGIYSAESHSETTLTELRKNGRDATTTNVSKTTNAANFKGATASIPALSGSTTGTISWPSGSISPIFTICSITRYTTSGTNNRKILRSVDGAQVWFHGHWKGVKGVCYYNMSVTPETSSAGPLDNWLVCCGSNKASSLSQTIPNNILIDGVARGTGNNAGSTTTNLVINSVTELSDWNFSQVFIWDQQLTNAELLVVSNALIQYLVDGVSFSNMFL
jgi:hypothetical protein